MVAEGDDLSQMRAGVPARSRTEDENFHLHAGRPGLPQGRGRARNVYHS